MAIGGSIWFATDSVHNVSATIFLHEVGLDSHFLVLGFNPPLVLEENIWEHTHHHHQFINFR